MTRNGVSEVAILDVNNKVNNSLPLKDDIYKILDMIGAWDDVFGDKSKKVLLKPNLVHPKKSGSGHITDSRIVFALVELLLETGFKEKSIVLGEGCGVGFAFATTLNETMECVKAAGLQPIKEKYGIDIVDLNKDVAVEMDVPDPLVMDKVKIAKTVLESDLIINLPVMKTHIRTGVTLSLKNMKGVLPGIEKRKTHKLGIDEGIADLNSLVRTSLSVVDGIVGMEGNWEYPRDCVPLGLLIAGKDPVAVDTVCSKIMGFDPQKIRHINRAAEKQVGTMNESKIIVKGLQLNEINVKPFKPRFQSFIEDYPTVNIIDEYGCTGCYSSILSALVHLKGKGLKDKLKDLNIILAVYKEDSIKNLTGKTLIIGVCNKDFKDKGLYVPGCPPNAVEMIEAICELYGFNTKDVL
ncbi:MAG: DUF362 domain-containing protein [Bacillota bacterium]